MSSCIYFGLVCLIFFFFFKQKTAYEMRISDWSSDVCSSDLFLVAQAVAAHDLVGELLAAEHLFAAVQAAAVAQDVERGHRRADVDHRHDAVIRDVARTGQTAECVLDRERLHAHHPRGQSAAFARRRAPLSHPARKGVWE